MKQRDLFSYLNNETSPVVLREKISHELQKYEEQSKIVGSSVQIHLEEQNQKDTLTITQIQKMLRDFINGEIGLIELQYLSDVIQLGEYISVESQNINDWIFEMSDPEINGVFTKERAKEIIKKSKTV